MGRHLFHQGPLRPGKKEKKRKETLFYGWTDLSVDGDIFFFYIFPGGKNDSP